MDSLALEEAEGKAISLFDLPKGVPSALIAVDLQRDWYSRDTRISSAFPQLRHVVPKLLADCREVNLPVVHIRAKYDVTSATHVPFFKLLNPEKCADEVSPEPEEWAKELDGELVIHKPTFDAFFQTELHEHLQGMGIKRIYVCGLVTSACVLNTAFGGFRHGYEVILVSDACGDRTRMQHAQVIKMYSGYVFVACTAEELARLARFERQSATPLGDAHVGGCDACGRGKRSWFDVYGAGVSPRRSSPHGSAVAASDVELPARDNIRRRVLPALS